MNQSKMIPSLLAWTSINSFRDKYTCNVYVGVNVSLREGIKGNTLTIG